MRKCSSTEIDGECLRSLAECSMPEVAEVSRDHCPCQSVCRGLAEGERAVFKSKLMSFETTVCLLFIRRSSLSVHKVFLSPLGKEPPLICQSDRDAFFLLCVFLLVLLPNARRAMSLFFSSRAMRGATSATFTGLDDYSSAVNLKVWARTGSIFEEVFSTDRTTFADVKNSALRHFSGKSSYPRSPLTSQRTSVTSDDLDCYKLVSVEWKRTIDEKKRLSEERVKDGGQSVRRHFVPERFSFSFAR